MFSGMNTASRKKAPETVRAKLLAAAAHIAAEQGLSAITLDAVARSAGVSKGGLLHHYPGRQALIEALHADLLDRLDCRIQTFRANDPEDCGQFTRAYISAVVQPCDSAEESRLLGAAALATSTDPYLADAWKRWIGGHLAQSGAEDRSPTATAIRYAADGIWLADCTHTALPAPERDAVLALLIAQTFRLSTDKP